MIIHPSFLGHWKTRMLIKELDDPAAPLYLIRLWSHCQESKGAKFDNLPAVAVAMICEYDGDPEKLNAALINARWLSRDGDSIEVLGWEEHNAQLIASWENGRKGGRPRKNSGSEKSGNNPSKTHGIPMANPTQTDKRREDKRREDKNDTPPPKKGKSKKELEIELFNQLRIIWNDNRGGVRTRADNVAGERVRGFRKLVAEAQDLGYSPEEYMQAAMRGLRTDSFWKNKTVKLEWLFRESRFTWLAEAGFQAKENPNINAFEPFYCSLDEKKKRPFKVGDTVASWDDGTYETIESFVSQSIVKTKSGKTIDLTDYRLEQ